MKNRTIIPEGMGIAQPNFAALTKDDIFMGPHQQKPVTSVKMDAADISAIGRQSAAITVVSLATYLDEFGGKHVTLLCEKIIPPNVDYLTPGSKISPITGRVAADCPVLNCVDSQCRKYEGQVWMPKDVVP